jgi:hypothetical protein
MESLEAQIEEWRRYVGQSPAVDRADIDELEAHLRDQITDLGEAGLEADEAFLVAVKRMGDVDALSREFAREHSDRLWKQLVLTEPDREERASNGLTEALVFAVAAATVTQVARLLADYPAEEPSWFFRNVSLFVLPFLAWYFVRRRHLTLRSGLVVTTPFLLAAIVVNLYPWAPDSDTERLVALYLPAVLWFAVAIPYMGGIWRSHDRRMDFVRFSGEWSIYYVLIAIAGGALVALTAVILDPIDSDLSQAVVEAVLPSGAAGAVIVAAWLVEAKASVVENMAPVLAKVFTPLFALMLTGAAIVYAVTWLGGDFDRDVLVVFDVMLVMVLGLVVYGISARGPLQPPGLMDRIQLEAMTAALVLDLMVLGTMVARIGDLGFTPNRAAALGLNLALLVNLAGAAVLSLRFVSGRVAFHRLERWQTAYLPVFAGWAAAVVVVVPPLFGFE